MKTRLNQRNRKKRVVKSTKKSTKTIEEIRNNLKSRVKNFPFPKINKKYIITHQINRGGYGVVWMAYDNPFHILGKRPPKPEKLEAFLEDIKGQTDKTESARTPNTPSKCFSERSSPKSSSMNT